VGLKLYPENGLLNSTLFVEGLRYFFTLRSSAHYY